MIIVWFKTGVYHLKNLNIYTYEFYFKIYTMIYN